MNNKVIGNNFEKEFAEILKREGFWVTYMTPKQYVGSQPCDLIAIKDDIPVLIDCKTCKTNLFPVSRIEQNQRLASKRYEKCGNTKYYLAIKSYNKIYIIDLRYVDFTKKYIDLTKEKAYENNCCK